MRTGQHPPALRELVLLLALCGLLSSCGVTSPEHAVGGAPPPSSTSGIYVGTPGTVTSLPPGRATPALATAPPGVVRLVLDKTTYAPGGSATVTIQNGLDRPIDVTNHHTNCGYVQLQRFVGSAWQPIGACPTQPALRLVALAPGSATTQRISIPSGPDALGTYQVVLTYDNTNTAVSATFLVR